jgi:hypothetical protein
MTKLNVKGHSNLLDISAENMDLSGGLNVKGQSIFIDVSAQNLEIKQNMIVIGNVLGNAFDNIVSLTTNQTINGAKTFTSQIFGNITGNATTVTSSDYSTNNIVTLTTTQTISGAKTFTDNIVCSQISSTKFRSLDAHNNHSLFLVKHTNLSKTFKTGLVLNGGKLLWILHLPMIAKTTGLKTFHFNLLNSSNVQVMRRTLRHYFNKTTEFLQMQEMWTTGGFTGTYSLQITRAANDWYSGRNQQTVVFIQEFPY